MARRTICEHKLLLFKPCRRRRNLMPRADDDKVDGNGDDIFILPNMRLLSMPSSLQSTEQQLLFAAMQLHEMCSDSSGDDGRRRRHVLSSLQVSSDEADDMSDI